jgi:HAD superfamily hydrolase (TIGR01509 family)
MIPDPLDAVIFDMDGVVLDTEALYRTAILAACAEQGQAMPDHVHLSLIGASAEDSDVLLRTHFGDRLDLERFHVTCTARFNVLCQPAVALRPGTRQILDYLRLRGIPRAIATSTVRPLAEAQLSAARVLDCFDVLVTRSDVINGKPHPEPFLKAAAALGVRPERCLALEDSYNGIRSAAAAGMTTIMVPDLLPPTPETRRLCAGILPNLAAVQDRLAAAWPVIAAPAPATRP